MDTPEHLRLQESRERRVCWKRWGPYLSERAWGTVREDYSADGAAWNYFPHDHARSRAYRWNEDGIAGICDDEQLICFALALWNGKDPILKERMFGLTGNEGNHGEDAKEYYFYLDNTPTHSYMKMLYKYPQAEFPYARLVEGNRRRGKRDPELELLDTGVFDGDRYFDVFVEYAKGDLEDILIRITAANRGQEAAELRVLPTIWFRNTWSWGYPIKRPRLARALSDRQTDGRVAVVELDEPTLGARWLYCAGQPELLFTENETNAARLFGAPNRSPYVKDGINQYVVHGDRGAVNPDGVGTRCAADYRLMVEPGQSAQIRLRLTNREFPSASSARNRFGAAFERVFDERKAEADAFYATVIPPDLSDDARSVMRQALAGLLWSKQFYHYTVEQWLDGDPAGPPPPAQRRTGRNHGWEHLNNADVISMPDKWEYPWYAAWDLACHCIPLALVDSEFAKEQLVLLVREWYMHPNGQLPAYEWALDDVNPPLHAWAARRVYQIERRLRGQGDRRFLERVFHKLLLNFTWWVNRKDAQGMNIFQGGFLGMDNIGVFDRNVPLPNGGFLEQSDGTSWMAMYTLNMLAIALELAAEDPVYEDVATKFWEHFLGIAAAMNNLAHRGIELWDEEDGFFYDYLHLEDGRRIPMRVRSVVGLIPLLAVETLESDLLDRMPEFRERMEWLLAHRPDLTAKVACVRTRGSAERRLLSVVDRDQLRRVLSMMLDESEFLSPHGIRSVSRYHRDHPFTVRFDGQPRTVDYEPAESTMTLFGGNSNWRGPVWWPINYLLIEALQKYHYYYGDELKVECPTRSGRMLNLWEVSQELSRRLTRTFLRDASGRRPVYGGTERFQTDARWGDHVLFFEYFNGDDGAGLGASHQTGWTGLIAKLMQQSGE